MSAHVTIEAAADEAKTTRALRVSKITREAQDIASFELVDPLGLELPQVHENRSPRETYPS
jgi:hypothetical protein